MAPLSGGSRATVRPDAVREVQLCKDGKGKVGLKLCHIDNVPLIVSS